MNRGWTRLGWKCAQVGWARRLGLRLGLKLGLGTRVRLELESVWGFSDQGCLKGKSLVSTQYS